MVHPSTRTSRKLKADTRHHVVQGNTNRIITQTYSQLLAQMNSPKIAEVFAAISDDSSLELFRIVALANSTSHDLRDKTKLTRKQYYSRLHRLTKSGLVRRKDKSYSLTTLGKILFDAETTVEGALENFWRIRAIDSLEASDGMPTEEHKKLIETLINDESIKTILAK